MPGRVRTFRFVFGHLVHGEQTFETEGETRCIGKNAAFVILERAIVAHGWDRLNWRLLRDEELPGSSPTGNRPVLR